MAIRYFRKPYNRTKGIRCTSLAVAHLQVSSMRALSKQVLGLNSGRSRKSSIPHLFQIVFRPVGETAASTTSKRQLHLTDPMYNVLCQDVCLGTGYCLNTSHDKDKSRAIKHYTTPSGELLFLHREVSPKELFQVTEHIARLRNEKKKNFQTSVYYIC